MTNLTPEQKIACIDKELELMKSCSEFLLTRLWSDKWWVKMELTSPDEDKIKIEVEATTLYDAINEAYARVRRHLDRVPEFDANKTIEYKPGENEYVKPDDGDEILF